MHMWTSTASHHSDASSSTRQSARRPEQATCLQRRDYRRAMQEADLLSNVVRLADSVLLAALAAQVAAPALVPALSTVSHSHGHDFHCLSGSASQHVRTSFCW